jgi:uncharacterized membrane protein YqjE
MREEAVRGLGTGELVRRLVNNISGIMDREVELAKQEAKSEAVTVGTGAVVLGLGLLTLYMVIPAVIIAIIFAIAPTLEIWAGALIAAGVFLVLGAILALIGWNRVKVTPMEKTRETIRENVEWARHRMTSPEK